MKLFQILVPLLYNRIQLLLCNLSLIKPFVLVAQLLQPYSFRIQEALDWQLTNGNKGAYLFLEQLTLPSLRVRLPLPDLMIIP